MIDWFLKVKLEINSRPLPAYAENNRKVSMLDLYLAVKREGGHRHITDNHMWAVIAKDMGLDYNDAELMRLMYAMYLDVLVYYNKIKCIQGAAEEKEVGEDIGAERRTRSMEPVAGTSEQTAAEQEGETDEHFALFAGNYWKGIRRLNTRRRFNFKRAKAAVDDANISVLTHSRKRNHV
ncbi:putative transcription factor & chromatin remodeling ARID family [Helianthus annuus]|nr:putative transcription factor & chromatin remodeling ARID family [Helianthus annuus]